MKWQVPASAQFADGTQVTPGRLFGWAEQLKRQVAVTVAVAGAESDAVEYVIKDQTLEQVFLRLAAKDGAVEER